MSTTTNGRRPGQARPSPAVYRRRRIVALLVLLVVVAAVVWGVTALLGRGKDADAATDEPGAAEAAAADDAATDEPAGEVAACDAAALDTDLELDPAEPTSGSTVRFEVTLTNSGDTPCLVDAGPATLVAAVGSGSDSVWRSDHCADDATNELLLDTGAETSVALAWDGRRSASGCPGDQPQVGSGTYRVSLTLDGEPVERGRVFTLG